MPDVTGSGLPLPVVKQPVRVLHPGGPPRLVDECRDVVAAERPRLLRREPLAGGGRRGGRRGRARQVTPQPRDIRAQDAADFVGGGGEHLRRPRPPGDEGGHPPQRGLLVSDTTVSGLACPQAFLGSLACCGLWRSSLYARSMTRKSAAAASPVAVGLTRLSVAANSTTIDAPHAAAGIQVRVPLAAASGSGTPGSAHIDAATSSVAVGQAAEITIWVALGLDGPDTAFSADATATTAKAAVSATHAPRDRSLATVAAPTTISTRTTAPTG